MNRSEIVAAVKSYLNRPNLPPSDINSMISSVEGELNRGLKEHPRNFKRAQYRIPTVNGEGLPYEDDTPLVPLPSDIATLVSVFTDTRRYKAYPPEVIPATGYIERGTCLNIYPTPERGTMVYLDYYSFLRPLAADLDANWVSTYFGDLYLYGTLKEAAVYLKDDSRFVLWQAEFLRRLEDVRRQGWNQNAGASPASRDG